MESVFKNTAQRFHGFPAKHDGSLRLLNTKYGRRLFRLHFDNNLNHWRTKISWIMLILNLSSRKFSVRAVARFLCLGGGAEPDPDKFSEPRSGEEKCFGLLGDSGGMLPRKIFNPIRSRLFYRFKGPGGVFRDPPKISGTIEGSSMKLCTLIPLLKVYQNP